MLPKSDRLTTEDIQHLSNGKSVFATLISMRFAPVPALADGAVYKKAAKTKFSVSVSKKVAPRAVDRNRIRRRVYAAIRKAALTDKLNTKSPVFIMLMPKKECMTAPIEAISAELQSMFRKANI